MAETPARERILDVAERLFAERGLEAVSLRGINAEAGLSAAALHYHFGTKEALVEAILLRRMPALMGRRRDLLDQIDAEGGATSVRDVVKVLVHPLLDLVVEEGEAGVRYVRFIARAWGDRRLDPEFVQRHFASGVDRLGPLLQRALPDLAPNLVWLRLGFALETALRSLADLTAPSSVSPPEAAELSLQDRGMALIDFIAGGLEASSHVPVSRLRPKKAARARKKPTQEGDRP